MGRLGHRGLRQACDGSEKTCADKPCPHHFFASCGGAAGGSLPRGGALFKNSHQAASPTSSEPKNSSKPSSGGTVDCPGVAGVVAGVAAGGEAGGGGGAAAPTIAHQALSSNPLVPVTVKINLRGRTRICGFVRKIIKIDIVLQHLQRIRRTFIRSGKKVKVFEIRLRLGQRRGLMMQRRTHP